MGVERLFEGANFRIPFSTDEINLIYQFGEQIKADVIGCFYATLFCEAGYDTTIYARGKRLESLKKNGLNYIKKHKK